MRVAGAFLDMPDVVHDILMFMDMPYVMETHYAAAGSALHGFAMREAADAFLEDPPALGTADTDLQIPDSIGHGRTMAAPLRCGDFTL
jgi:hypothetical protein